MDPSTFTGVPRFSVPMVPLQNPSVPFIVVATFTHAGIMLHLTYRCNCVVHIVLHQLINEMDTNHSRLFIICGL